MNIKVGFQLHLIKTKDKMNKNNQILKVLSLNKLLINRIN